MKIRFSVLGLAFLASLFFVIFRVGYKVIFGGTGGTGTQLPALPAISLPAPFSHIQLFGPVTLEGISQTVVLAAPFAFVIFCFGFVSALIDPVKLNAVVQRRNFPPLIKSLGISLSTLPALIAASKSIRNNNYLRGNKHIVSYLVPILEHSIERAFALAANLELAARKPISATSDIAIRARQLKIDELAIGNLEISGPGIYFLTGANGAGKSSLLRSLAGLASQFDGRDISGSVEIFGLDVKLTPLLQLASVISYVPQNPRISMVGATVADELELRKLKLSSRFSLDSELAGLSEGEARMFSIELALSSDPKILLLDEPFTSLDDQEENAIFELIQNEAKKRVILIAIPDLEGIRIAASKTFQISKQGIADGAFSADLEKDTAIYPGPGPEIVLWANELEAKFGSRVLFQGLGFTAQKSSITAIVGHNGSGKSTLLSMLAGNNARLVPENFRDFFVADSLENELAFSDKVAKQAAGFTGSLFFSILNGALNQETEKLLQTHPRDLSEGTQLALAIAIQLAHKPTAILIDEPTRGFDLIARDSVARILKCVAETGTAVIFATHDKKLEKIAHRVLELKAGQLSEVSVAKA